MGYVQLKRIRKQANRFWKSREVESVFVLAVGMNEGKNGANTIMLAFV